MQMRINQIQVQMQPSQGNQMQVQVQMPHLHLHLQMQVHLSTSLVSTKYDKNGHAIIEIRQVNLTIPNFLLVIYQTTTGSIIAGSNFIIKICSAG